MRGATSCVRIEVASVLAPYSQRPAFSCTYDYAIYGTGDVVVKTTAAPRRTLPPLPRLGLQLRLPGSLDRFAWYGRGPHESYVDRKESARIGLYLGTVQEQYVPYIYPQENGNKTDVRWAAITDVRGMGLLVTGMPLVNVSAHHYTPEDLAAATHAHELVRRDETIVNLDHAQAPLGSASCGPGPLEKYLLKAEPAEFAVRLRPFSEKTDSAARRSSEMLEEATTQP